MAHPSISHLRDELRRAEKRKDVRAATRIRAKLKAAEKQRRAAGKRGEARAAGQGKGRNRDSAEYRHHVAKAKDKRLPKQERLKHAKLAQAVAMALFVPGAAPFVVAQAAKAKELRRKAMLARQKKNYAVAGQLDEQAKRFETQAESYQYDPDAPRTAARAGMPMPDGPMPSPYRVPASPMSTRRPQVAVDEADTSEDSSTDTSSDDTGIAGVGDPWYKRYALPLALAAGVGALVAFGGKGRGSSMGASTLRVKTSTVRRVRRVKAV